MAPLPCWAQQLPGCSPHLLQEDAQSEHSTALLGRKYEIILKNFDLFFTPVDSNKICHHGVTEEVSRNFLTAGLPMTRSVKSLCKSGNLFSGAICVGKSSLATFCLALPVQIQHLAASIPAKHSQNICHSLLLLETYRAEQAVQHSMPACLWKIPSGCLSLLCLALCTLSLAIFLTWCLPPWHLPTSSLSCSSRWLAQALLHKQQSVSSAVTPPRRRCADFIWHWHTSWIKISKKGSSGVGVSVDLFAWRHRCCSNRFFFFWPP